MLDSGAAGQLDAAFDAYGGNGDVVSTAIGFVRASDPFDWKAYGFPALVVDPTGYEPMSVSPDGPVIAVSKGTLDAMMAQMERLAAEAASMQQEVLVPSEYPVLTDTGMTDSTEDYAATAAEAQATMVRLAEELQSYIDAIQSDDASDGVISQTQAFSMTVPGQETEVVAELSFDLESTDDGARWVGGIGADVTMSGMEGPVTSQTISIEFGYGQQRIDDAVNVIMLEPGPGTSALLDGTQLSGTWLAPISMGEMPVAAALVAQADADVTLAMKGTAAATSQSLPGRALQHHLAQATQRVLAALVGASADASKAQVARQTWDGASGDTMYDTLWVKLVFDAKGGWTDLAIAPGVAEQAPADEAFESIQDALALLEEQTGETLPSLELRRSASSDGFVRLDVVATDLIVQLIPLGAEEGGLEFDPPITAGDIPDLSLITIGGMLTDGRLDGQAIVLMFVEDVHFTQ